MTGGVYKTVYYRPALLSDCRCFRYIVLWIYSALLIVVTGAISCSMCDSTVHGEACLHYPPPGTHCSFSNCITVIERRERKLQTQLTVSLSLSISVYLCLCLSVCLHACMPICVSVCLSASFCLKTVSSSWSSDRPHTNNNKERSTDYVRRFEEAIRDWVEKF